MPDRQSSPRALRVCAEPAFLDMARPGRRAVRGLRVPLAFMLGPPLLLAACQSGTPLKVPPPDAPISTVRYQCQQGKTMIADYFDGPTRTASDGRPIPGGRVVVQLGDGRKFSLPQTLSGSGIRYADSSESVVFWSKGDTAFVEEGPSKTVTYADCVTRKG